ncbi:MAG: AAA family ATPase [Candidatus Poribacteria bacterium]|nr:AAA family ATPase [Candidatus Poribacteria bacterium]
MKIKSIHLKNFKRFTDLTIEGLPETAKLVVMIGPNGSGKSSALEALQFSRQAKGFFTFSGSPAYYLKSVSSENNRDFNVVSGNVEIIFHGEAISSQAGWKRAFHLRSSYRNDSMERDRITLTPPPIETEQRFTRLTENDQAVAANYSRLFSQLMERCSAVDQREKNVGELQDKVFGELRETIDQLFSDQKLVLNGLGNPGKGEIFQFSKGRSQEFSYEVLSSGEKAALDLLLDITVTKVECNDTVFCIDEPEAHIHTKLQGALLEQLYKLIPDNSQLWIATHSAGMVRKAQDLHQDNLESVVFLDFGKDNFDEPVTLKPIIPDPDFWARTYEVALGDLTELVVTGRTVFCEGEEFDEECYRNIFKDLYPEVCFVSLGARSNVEKSVTAANLAIEKIAEKAKVIGIVDRDKATCGEIKRNAEKGIRTLSRTTLESYLLDDEVLTKLCEDYDASDKTEDLLAGKQNALDKFKLKLSDNLKPIVQQVHGAAQKALKSANLGNSKESFMMDVLATRIQPGMKVYEELHEDIFGE